MAVMDRIAAYIPGWEIPKNSSEFVNSRYGPLTHYLAEAFYYQFKHMNRYEEVSKRIRLGKSIEGRDEKGIKKTVCAFLKILHPSGTPTDVEFEEYVAYVVECRRQVKEQMNKRKPDDELAKINLSYTTAKGEEVVVFVSHVQGRRCDASRLFRSLRKWPSNRPLVFQSSFGGGFFCLGFILFQRNKVFLSRVDVLR